MFFKSQQFEQAAECYMKVQEYDLASRMFEESKLYFKALECYEQQQNWEGLLQCMNRNKHNFTQDTWEQLINKYVPVALNSIFLMINESGVPEENRGKLIEEKYI